METIMIILGLPIALLFALVVTVGVWPLLLGILGAVYFSYNPLMAVSFFGACIVLQIIWFNCFERMRDE